MHELSKSQREQLVIAGGADTGANVNLVGILFWFDAACPDGVIERAVNLIVEHEQALRLRLAARGGGIFQYETEYAYQAVPAERVALPREEAALREGRLMNAIAFVPGDPLYDFKIVRTESAVGLRSCFHHVIMDGRSLMIFGSRLGEYVGLLRENRPVRCETHRFTDSLAPERELLESERCRASWRYWRETTRDWNTLCAMNPEVGASSAAPGRQLTKELDREYGRRINEHCERYGISPAYLFQTALAIFLLQRNPGIRFADMGQTMAARRSAREKKTLGNYALEMFLRIPVRDEDSLGTVQEAVREANFESLSRSLCTYEDIVAMKRESMPGVPAMRDLMLTYIPPREQSSAAFDMDWLANDSPETSVEFFVYHVEDRDCFTIVFDYRTDIYSDAGAGTAFASIMALVDACLADPSMTVREARKRIE